MRDTFDAIIVGSGLGGLTAAATLAKNGYRVAVFERHSQPGGYATTFFRDDFEFEVSLHAMSGVGTPGNPGPLYHFYQALGITDKVNFIPLPDLYRTIADGVDITIPRSPMKAEAVLIGAFPHEAEGIHAFIEQIMTVGKEVQLIREGGYSTRPLPTLARFPNLAHAAGTTVADVMDRVIFDSKVKLILGQLWGYFGLPPKKLSFLLFAAGVSSYLRWGSVTIEGKSQSLSNAYVQVIEANHGEVHLSEGVREILVEDGRVVGIMSERGIRYMSSIVISNADPYSTLNRLIDKTHVEPRFIRRLEAAQPSTATVTLYLGLDRPSSAVGIHNHEIYINIDEDMDSQWEKCTSLTMPGVVSVCAYDHSNPQFAPEGKGVLAVTILQQGAPWIRLSPEVYAIEKERYSEMLLGIVDNHFPGVRKAIQTSVLSTPVTNVRYTGNPHGAVYGFANTPKENPGFRMDNRGPVKGLWFAGAWTRPSAGYQGVITSGYNTASDILAEWGVENILPYGTGPDATASEGALRRRLNGWKLMLRDGKRVGKVIRSKYRKYDNTPLAPDFVNSYDVSSPFHARNMQMTIVSRIIESSDTVTLRLFATNAAPLKFRSGQYVDVTADIRGKTVTRAYSISSSPKSGKTLDITVKSQPNGTMSPWLVNDARVGDTVRVTGPFGEFSHVPMRDTSDVVAIAVGSGITPFMSMLREMDMIPSAPKFHLIYGSRREEEIIFRNEIDAICSRNPNIQVTHMLSRPSRFWAGRRGRVDIQAVMDIVNDGPEKRTFFICGPAALYRPLSEMLLTLHVPKARIRFESFRTTFPKKDEIKPFFTINHLRSADWLTMSFAQSSHALCHLSQNPGLTQHQCVRAGTENVVPSV
ncbi:MAG: FAD-dependent oxidoreductase [Deltaproteobacteria bacterium]|nr:FAD-dependent oxidoreductase [Deltaproteobacteria bacterium]